MPSSETSHCSDTPESSRNQQRMSIADISQLGIFLLLLLASIKYASAILIPLTLAILQSLLLTPIVTVLESIHIPKRIGAFFVVTAIVAIIIASVTILSGPAEEWLDKTRSCCTALKKS